MRISVCVAIFALFVCSNSAIRAAVAENNDGPTELQTKLTAAENDFKAGKIESAIDQATALTTIHDGSFFKSDQVVREAKAYLAVFKLKAGHPDEAARLIREILISLQLEFPADAKFSTNAAELFAGAPQTLKTYFAEVIRRLGENTDTQQIINSLIDNTVPRNYAKRLQAFGKHLQPALAQLDNLKETTDGEELRYGDPLTSIDCIKSDKTTNPALTEKSLNELARTLDALANEAQQMPVGDARATVGVYKLALAANSAGHYLQAETFATQAIQHIDALASDMPIHIQAKLVLAYALLKQGKMAEFKTVRDELLKVADRNKQERLLISLARFTEASGDEAFAAAIYKRTSGTGANK